jgi:hypothetical protein
VREGGAVALGVAEGLAKEKGFGNAPAEGTQRTAEIDGEDVQQEVSSATSAKECYQPGVISHKMNPVAALFHTLGESA